MLVYKYCGIAIFKYYKLTILCNLYRYIFMLIKNDSFFVSGKLSIPTESTNSFLQNRCTYEISFLYINMYKHRRITKISDKLY